MEELTEQQKRWLFKGEFIELFELFEEKRKEYSRLVSDLKGLSPGLHILKYDFEKGKLVQKEFNTYPEIEITLKEINSKCAEIEDIDKKLEEMRKTYQKKYKTKITYTQLVSELKGDKWVKSKMQ